MYMYRKYWYTFCTSQAIGRIRAHDEHIVAVTETPSPPFFSFSLFSVSLILLLYWFLGYLPRKKKYICLHKNRYANVCRSCSWNSQKVGTAWMSHMWHIDILHFIQVLKYYPAIKRNELLRQQHGRSQM